MKKKIFVTALALSLNFGFSVIAMASVIGPGEVPETTTQCKSGGWQTYDGLFKNQGDCVSFVVTDGQNAPDGPNA